MSVHELNREQMVELKQAYICESAEGASWLDMANADVIVSDEEVAERYAGTDFCDDDFFCTMEGAWE